MDDEEAKTDLVQANKDKLQAAEDTEAGPGRHDEGDDRAAKAAQDAKKAEEDAIKAQMLVVTAQKNSLPAESRPEERRNGVRRWPRKAKSLRRTGRRSSRHPARKTRCGRSSTKEAGAAGRSLPPAPAAEEQYPTKNPERAAAAQAEQLRAGPRGPRDPHRQRGRTPDPARPGNTSGSCGRSGPPVECPRSPAAPHSGAALSGRTGPFHCSPA